MRKFITILWVTLAIAALMTAPSGCKPKQADAPPTAPKQADVPPTAPKQADAPTVGFTHFSVSSSTAGHDFKADFYGDGGITDPGMQTATKFLSGQRLSIEKERLLIDGSEAAKIPAAARVEIVLSNSTLSVTADGTNVLSTTIHK